MAADRGLENIRYWIQLAQHDWWQAATVSERSDRCLLYLHIVYLMTLFLTELWRSITGWRRTVKFGSGRGLPWRLSAKQQRATKNVSQGFELGTSRIQVQCVIDWVDLYWVPKLLEASRMWNHGCPFRQCLHAEMAWAVSRLVRLLGCWDRGCIC